ncbi:MAG: YwaF family protein, partial [Clostridia bacterium]|nr:YwaF family protein [Clostridia bacterium]
MGNFQPTIDYVSVKTNGVNFLEQILKFLSAQMDRPTLYGWYHILCFVVTIGLCVLVYFKARKLTDKQFNLILGLSGALLLLLELYKQLQYSYDHVTDTWGYQWYAFPFQFCATPMYILVLASLLKNGKVKDSLCSYLATYALFAGTAVMFYPGDVFIRVIGINIQTMIHHGGMVVIGVFMYVSGRVKFSHTTVLKALPTFCTCLGLAMIMNILYGHFGDPNQDFNMFFISPYYPCTLPVLSSIYGKEPYPIFMIVYIFVFT